MKSHSSTIKYNFYVPMFHWNHDECIHVKMTQSFNNHTLKLVLLLFLKEKKYLATSTHISLVTKTMQLIIVSKKKKFWKKNFLPHILFWKILPPLPWFSAKKQNKSVTEHKIRYKEHNIRGGGLEYNTRHVVSSSSDRSNFGRRNSIRLQVKAEIEVVEEK